MLGKAGLDGIIEDMPDRPIKFISRNNPLRREAMCVSAWRVHLQPKIMADEASVPFRIGSQVRERVEVHFLPRKWPARKPFPLY
jgi:hypothetical protein